MKVIVYALAALLLAFSDPVAAANAAHNRYKWKDAEGNVHFADSLPADAAQFGYDIVNSQGLVTKHVDRAKTPEELKAAEQEAKQQAAARHEAEEKNKKDQQMLAAYPSEADLVKAQQAQLDMLDQHILGTRIGIESQEKSLTELLSHAAELDRTGKPVPTTLQQQIETLRLNIEKQKAYAARKQQDKIDTAKNFAAELEHYRELNAKAKVDQ